MKSINNQRWNTNWVRECWRYVNIELENLQLARITNPIKRKNWAHFTDQILTRVKSKNLHFYQAMNWFHLWEPVKQKLCWLNYEDDLNPQVNIYVDTFQVNDSSAPLEMICSHCKRSELILISFQLISYSYTWRAQPSKYNRIWSDSRK